MDATTLFRKRTAVGSFTGAPCIAVREKSCSGEAKFINPYINLKYTDVQEWDDSDLVCFLNKAAALWNLKDQFLVDVTEVGDSTPPTSSAVDHICVTLRDILAREESIATNFTRGGKHACFGNLSSFSSTFETLFEPDSVMEVFPKYCRHTLQPRSRVALIELETNVSFHKGEYDPIAHAVTRALAFRTRCAILNLCESFILIHVIEDHKSEIGIKVKVSRNIYHSPHKPAVTNEWSVWEVMIRFLLSSSNCWYLSCIPVCMKRMVTQIIQQQDYNTPYLIPGISYADLWAPLRFAIPATHSIEEECSPMKFDGDSILLSHSRSGPVYRKSFQGYDCAIKLAIFSRKINIDDSTYAYPKCLRAEMERELQVYSHLCELQGKYIPKLLWHGELITGVADALVTEYCGLSLENDELSVTVKKSAISALNAVHAHGIAHGDVALKNFVSTSQKCVFILDFGFSEFREEFESDFEWKELVQEEMFKLKCILDWY